MLHVERLTRLYRLFDLSSLVQMPYDANYSQVVDIISDSKKNQYADFQLIQQDAVNYLINDKFKSNFIELQLVNIKYTFEIFFEYHNNIIDSGPQYNEDNVKITNSSFLPFNYKNNSEFDITSIAVKPVASVELTVESDIADVEVTQSMPDVESTLTKPISLSTQGDFKTRLKKIIKKVDYIVEEKQRVKGLKQSKAVNEIARKLDEFIQKNQLDKKPQAVEKVSEDEVIASKVENIDSKPSENLVIYQEQGKFNYTPVVTNSIFVKLLKPISQKTKESTALVIYEKADEICTSNDKFMELIPYVYQHCTIPFLYNRNISFQETTPYILSEILGRKFKEYANPVCVESEEPLVNPIVRLFLIIKNAGINFYSKKYNDSYIDGGGAPPQPPGGFGIFLGSYSGKVEFDPVKKHIGTIFIANLGLDAVRQPFFQELINALYENIYSVEDAYKLLSTVSFDSIYEYYLVYQGNGIGRLIYNISGIDVFLDNSADVKKEEENVSDNNSRGVVNEDGMRELYEVEPLATDSTSNQQTTENVRTIGEPIAHISNDDISFIQDLNEEEKEEGASCFSFISLIFDKIGEILKDWSEDKKKSIISELEVPLLDKGGENDEIKHSNGNKMPSEKGSYLPPLSNDFKIENLENTIDDVENHPMKLNLNKVSKDGGKSGVSTATSTPRDGINIVEPGAPTKGKNPSGKNNILLTSKFSNLDLEDTKKEEAQSSKKEFIISFTKNGECEITTDKGTFAQKKTPNPKYIDYVAYVAKTPDKRDEYEDLKSRCNAPNKEDDGNNEFNKGEKGDTLNLDEITISSQELFKDIDDL